MLEFTKSTDFAGCISVRLNGAQVGILEPRKGATYTRYGFIGEESGHPLAGNSWYPLQRAKQALTSWFANTATPAATPAAIQEDLSMTTTKRTRKAPARPRQQHPTRGKGGRPATFKDEQRVKLLVAENPKRAGTKRAKRFNGYLAAAKAARGKPFTVAQARAHGVMPKDLRWDTKHGFIQVLTR